MLVDVGSEDFTFIDGKPVFSATAVRAESAIGVGEWTLSAWIAPRGAVEESLLDGIRSQPHDHACRLVYVDWLEQEGRMDQAEYVRLESDLAQMTNRGTVWEEGVSRLRALSRATSVRWRHAMAQAPIQNCGLTFEFKCPGRWSLLTPGDTDDVRFCSACEKPVYYAANIVDARMLARRGDCVAVDVTEAQDVFPPHRLMGVVAPRDDDER